jgi:transcriptional regulator with XRE-family HTH domain
MARASKKQLRVAGRHLQTARHRALVAVIVEARAATGLSQREFAKKLGRPNNFVQRIEAGERPVSVLEFIDIAKAAAVAPDELLRRAIR